MFFASVFLGSSTRTSRERTEPLNTIVFNGGHTSLGDAITIICLAVYKHDFVRFVGDCARLSHLNTKVKRLVVECSKADAITTRTEESDAKIMNGLVHGLHDTVKLLCKRYKPSKLLKLRNESGVPSHDCAEEKNVVRSHFKKQLGGSVISFSELLEKDRSSAAHVTLSEEDVHGDSVHKILPTLYELACVSFESPANRGHGEDNVSGRLPRRFHHLFAMLFPGCFQIPCEISPASSMEGRSAKRSF